MDSLIQTLKIQIIKELKLEEALKEKQCDIAPDAPLFNNPMFMLDSIDALRIIVLLQKEYGVIVKDLMQGRKVLYSLTTIAKFIQIQKK